MPAPKPDDPEYCPNSDTTEFDTRSDTETNQVFGPWAVCRRCKRALKPQGVNLRPHRRRSRTTASLDKTRDVLAGITRDEVEAAR